MTDHQILLKNARPRSAPGVGRSGRVEECGRQVPSELGGRAGDVIATVEGDRLQWRWGKLRWPSFGKIDPRSKRPRPATNARTLSQNSTSGCRGDWNQWGTVQFPSGKLLREARVTRGGWKLSKNGPWPELAQFRQYWGTRLTTGWPTSGLSNRGAPPWLASSTPPKPCEPAKPVGSESLSEKIKPTRRRRRSLHPLPGQGWPGVQSSPKTMEPAISAKTPKARCAGLRFRPLLSARLTWPENRSK